MSEGVVQSLHRLGEIQLSCMRRGRIGGPRRVRVRLAHIAEQTLRISLDTLLLTLTWSEAVSSLWLAFSPSRIDFQMGSGLLVDY